MPRSASLLLCLLTTQGCATLNDVRIEQRWEEPVYFEVSRASTGLKLQVEATDAGAMLSVVENFECIEEATQLGAEDLYAKPKDVVRAVGGLVGGVIVAGAVAMVGGYVVDQILARNSPGTCNRDYPDPIACSWQQQRSVGSQIGATATGLVGVGTQVLLSGKIAEWLKMISFEDHRPMSRELGRKNPACDTVRRFGVLKGPRLPPEGLELKPRGRAPPGFLPRDGLTLDGQPVGY